jgi:hypothetical protein
MYCGLRISDCGFDCGLIADFNPQSAIRNPQYAGAIAKTLSGLPLPRSIFSGAAISTAPVGGSRSRLHKLASPNFPAPCMMV